MVCISYCVLARGRVRGSEEGEEITSVATLPVKWRMRNGGGRTARMNAH